MGKEKVARFLKAAVAGFVIYLAVDSLLDGEVSSSEAFGAAWGTAIVLGYFLIKDWWKARKSS